MATYTVAKAREELASVLDRVVEGREDMVLTRRGTEVAVIIPIQSYRLLQRVRQRIEDALTKLALAEVLEEDITPLKEVDEDHLLKRAHRRKKEVV